MKTLMSTFISLLMLTNCSGQQSRNYQGNAKPVSYDFWNVFLKKYVTTDGHVNYKSIKENKTDLESFIYVLSKSHPTASWTENEQKAYWINAYNAFTIKLIIDNYPLKSIKDIFLPWEKKFIKIETKNYSLGNIEHNILRKEFNDPRIHFAINCASYSCPKLLNHAYLPETLDKQLNAAAINFVNDVTKNKISPDQVELSSIFNWFTGDFTKKGSLIDFINQYSKIKINKSAEISYLTYNWNLNE